MNSGIYLILNTVNNKKYVGSTSSTSGFKGRWRRHKSGLRHNKKSSPHLQNAYNKYGEDKFVFSILEECTDDLLAEREEYWIAYYKTYNRDNGYNIRQPKRDKLAKNEPVTLEVMRYWINRLDEVRDSIRANL